MPREVGIIGIGDMGSKIAERLSGSGYSLVLYDRSKEKYKQFMGKEKIRFANSIPEFVQMLSKTGGGAVAWVMLPGGAVTNSMIADLAAKLTKDDIVIDASNSVYLESMDNAKILKDKSIFYLDVGLAGGPSDVLKGVSLMIGGEKSAYDRVEEVFRTLAGSGTYGYVGSSGSGHMAKLVHNVIFYGINPIYAEGVELLQKLKNDFSGSFDMQETLRLYAAAPPINGEMMSAIAEIMKSGEMPIEAPEMKVSSAVTWATKNASDHGVNMIITNAVLSSYSRMSEESRKIYAVAKKLITGH